MNVLKVNFQTACADQLFCESLKNTGFAVLENHPIDNAFISSIYQEWQSFFKSDGKSQYLFNQSTQDGFFSMGTSETAKGYSEKDIKEYYQYYPWGQYPQTLSPATKELYRQLNELARLLLGWLEQHLPDEIEKKLSMPLSHMVQDSEQTMLRILHYPPLTGQEACQAVRAAAHEDINLLTLLVGATAKGLQVQDNRGLWHDVPCGENQIVINAGDMLDLTTQHYYRSTTHRVINPKTDENVSRLSMPLFLHPRPEVQLSQEKTAGDYLNERLTELGVL